MDVDELVAEWDEHLRVVAEARELLPSIVALAARITEALDRGGAVITFGNGGSAAEAQHLAGELLGRFRATRRPLAAMALSSDPSVVTGIANDFGFDDVFARQVEALAGPGDVVIGISTSGRSPSVVRGLRAARDRGALAVAWTGADPGPAGAEAEIVLAAPATSTARVQEVHTLVMHTLCLALDAWAVPDPGTSADA